VKPFRRTLAQSPAALRGQSPGGFPGAPERSEGEAPSASLLGCFATARRPVPALVRGSANSRPILAHSGRPGTTQSLHASRVCRRPSPAFTPSGDAPRSALGPCTRHPPGAQAGLRDGLPAGDPDTCAAPHTVPVSFREGSRPRGASRSIPRGIPGGGERGAVRNTGTAPGACAARCRHCTVVGPHRQERPTQENRSPKVDASGWRAGKRGCSPGEGRRTLIMRPCREGPRAGGAGRSRPGAGPQARPG